MTAPIFTTESVSKPLIHGRIKSLASKLRRRQLIGSRNVALEVVKLMREVVAGAKFSSFEQLLVHIEEVGKMLQDAGPKELVVTNMTKRILKFLNEEYATALANSLQEAAPSSPVTPYSIPPTPALTNDRHAFPFSQTQSSGIGSMFELLGHKKGTFGKEESYSASGSTTPISTASPLHTAPPSANQSPSRSRTMSPLTTTHPSSTVTSILEEEFDKKSHILKPLFLDAMQELMEEVEETHRNVGEQSLDHIHSGEFILTIGQSKTVEAFLKAAHRKRKFTVIVAETAPSFSGRATALSLSSAGITTILIPDSNIFSLLPRCSKVLLGPHLVLADGALLTISGSLPLCMAANRMRVPVVVCGGMFKFCPRYLGEADWGMRDLGSPEEVLHAEDEGGESETEVLNPYYDVVPADLVSLYITNLGGHPSSLLYRLLSDMYGS